MEKPKTYKHRILDFLDTVGAKGADSAQIRAATGIPKANWGTLILMFRFPKGLINQAAIDPSSLNRAALVQFPGSDTYPAWRP